MRSDGELVAQTHRYFQAALDIRGKRLAPPHFHLRRRSSSPWITSSQQQAVISAPARSCMVPTGPATASALLWRRLPRVICFSVVRVALLPPPLDLLLLLLAEVVKLCFSFCNQLASFAACHCHSLSHVRAVIRLHHIQKLKCHLSTTVKGSYKRNITGYY